MRHRSKQPLTRCIEYLPPSAPTLIKGFKLGQVVLEGRGEEEKGGRLCLVRMLGRDWWCGRSDLGR